MHTCWNNVLFCFLLVLFVFKIDHDVIEAEIPIFAVWSLRVDLNHIDVLAPTREELRDVEREGRLVSWSEEERRQGIVCSDLLVDDTIGVDEDCGVSRRVVHGFAVEADEIEKGRYVGRGSGARFKHDPRP